MLLDNYCELGTAFPQKALPSAQNEDLGTSSRNLSKHIDFSD